MIQDFYFNHFWCGEYVTNYKEKYGLTLGSVNTSENTFISAT
jgi:hypothetical protein